MRFRPNLTQWQLFKDGTFQSVSSEENSGKVQIGLTDLAGTGSSHWWPLGPILVSNTRPGDLRLHRDTWPETRVQLTRATWPEIELLRVPRDNWAGGVQVPESLSLGFACIAVAQVSPLLKLQTILMMVECYSLQLHNNILLLLQDNNRTWK